MGDGGRFRGRQAPPLPNTENRPIKKGSAGSCSNRFQRRHGTFAPPHMHGCQLEVTFFDPDPSVLGRGQLFLVGVGRQQQDKGHSDKQDEKTSPHGGTVFPGGDAALALRKKRGFSLCSGAGVRSRVRQSGPLAALSMCAVPGARSGGQPCTRGSIAVFPAWGKGKRHSRASSRRDGGGKRAVGSEGKTG